MATLVKHVLRRKPALQIDQETGADTNGGELTRSIGLAQLSMFGIGATIGTGIFFVLSQAVPVAGPAVIISFVVAGIVAGLTAICYAELAGAVPASGSSYSYAYATLGELPAMAVGACLLLEYGVSAAAVSVGWSQYLNQLLGNLFGFQIPDALSQAPEQGGIMNLPAVILVCLCGVLLVRGASESAKANAIMVSIKLAILLLFIVVGVAGWNSNHFADFAPFGFSRRHVRRRNHLLLVHRPRRRVHCRRRSEEPSSQSPSRDPHCARVRHRDLHRRCRRGDRCTGFRIVRRSGSRAVRHPRTGDRIYLAGNTSGRRCGDLDLQRHARGHLRSTPHLFAMSRDGMIPSIFHKVNPRTLTPVPNTIIVCVVISILAGFIPINFLAEMTSIGTLVAFLVVSIGVIILRRSDPDLPRSFKVPGYPVTPILSILGCLWIIKDLRTVTIYVFLIWVTVAIIWYFAYGMKHSRLGAKNRAELGSESES